MQNFKPKYDSNLIRIGSEHDGGYLVEKKSAKKSDFLLSFGVNYNWDFEKHFKKPFLAYDDQISLKFTFFWFFKRCVSINSMFFYLKNRKSFIKGFVGIKPFTFDEIIESIPHKNIFLKIDIEGSEYVILDELIKHRKRFIGIIIEFHDVEKNLSKIINFIKKIELEIVHVHANNFGGISKNNTPKVLELTFSKFHNKKQFKTILPHSLDKPNNKYSKEIRIIFK